MSGTRGGLGRILAMGIALALALLLLAAREATAGKYTVAQCGWHLDADVTWADSTGGAKFRPDAWCATPTGADPFDGAHMKSFTKGGSTITGTRFARWRWVAPPGTGITRVTGTWWHTLHDGMEQRLGTGNAGGGFDPFLSAASTDTTPRDFVAGFPSPQPALEDRLLCARAEGKWCSIELDSWSAVRALTITIEDDGPPGAWVWGDLAAGGWRRGSQLVMFSGVDDGSGVRFGETLLDGNRISLHEYPCAKATIAGEWRGTRMQPCGPHGADGATIDTTHFSDGPHGLRHCETDFAGNVGCTAEQTVSIDNNPPAHPRNLTLAGGDSWRRVDNFDFSWGNPEQGSASPIGGAYWRIADPSGYDTGVQFAAGHDISALADRALPRPGVYTFRIWLRDEAGNANPASAIDSTMRLDDVPPGVAFEAVPDRAGTELPQAVSAEVSDENSGPAGGEIAYKRLNAEHWIELPTRLEAGSHPASARLVAAVPEGLGPGTYVFSANGADAAGNTASTTRRVDGTEMALRKTGPVAPSRAVDGQGETPGVVARAKTRLFARLRWHHRHGSEVTVPFGAGARLSGRLFDADGAGLAGRRLRVVSRPSHGALDDSRFDSVQTGPHGGFELALTAGPSRRITVSYPGGQGLAGARRPALALRVRGALSLNASPADLRTGQTVRFWGRVRTRGAPMPRRGKLVAIQYYENAARIWRPVLVTRSDHSGRFRTRYRFRYIAGTAKIRLRAVALAEERWPYVPGASRPVTVRVSG